MRRGAPEGDGRRVDDRAVGTIHGSRWVLLSRWYYLSPRFDLVPSVKSIVIKLTFGPHLSLTSLPPLKSPP